MEKAVIMEKEVLMADTSVSFKCPNCSAPLAYAPGADHVTCEYCGTELSIADLEVFYAAKEENAAKAEEARQKSGILTVRERNGAKTRRRFSAPLPVLPAERKSSAMKIRLPRNAATAETRR